MSKTIYITNWETWKELCESNNLNPYKTIEFGIDMGGGNSKSYEYVGDFPEQEREESEAQIFMKNWLETKEGK